MVRNEKEDCQGIFIGIETDQNGITKSSKYPNTQNITNIKENVLIK